MENTYKRKAYAKVIKSHIQHVTCKFCGEYKDVQTIEYGVSGAESANILNICKDCRNWFGRFLASDNNTTVKEIE